MLLTPQIINSSHHFVNQSNQRQLDLRSKGIAQIANTHATLNYFQSIDLSDNSIEIITNFSFLDGLRTLIISNNRVRKIQPISSSLPNLENLFLLGNKISRFEQIVELKSCTNLKRLVLINNPVTQKEYYRMFIIYHIKSLVALDFKPISNQQRNQAKFYLSKAKLIHS